MKKKIVHIITDLILTYFSLLGAIDFISSLLPKLNNVVTILCVFGIAAFVSIVESIKDFTQP